VQEIVIRFVDINLL